jgi:alpha-tubulin suppressor-like RCC1 family protein
VNVTIIATGARGSHSCVITRSNGFWCWGANSQGQLGIGNNIEQYSPVSVNIGTGEFTAHALHARLSKMDNNSS